jgi:DNA-binding PadR family transcriptional regulator
MADFNAMLTGLRVSRLFLKRGVAARGLHGYAVAKQLGVRPLIAYRILGRLEDENLVKSAVEQPHPSLGGPERRVYRPTDIGLQTFAEAFSQLMAISTRR